LVLYGIATDLSGQKTSKQSKHFVCTSCHNIEREDPDLSVADPQARLEYVVEKGLPFLQGTALYGAVNRTSFYNDDYVKKYGDLVFKAKNNLREAIQLCAVECSQGRTLESWELESVLAYLWSIQLKLEDLQLNDEEMKSIEEALNNKGDKKGMIALIKSKYLQASPATLWCRRKQARREFEYRRERRELERLFINLPVCTAMRIRDIPSTSSMILNFHFA
jgi:hypothetical protein